MANKDYVLGLAINGAGSEYCFLDENGKMKYQHIAPAIGAVALSVKPGIRGAMINYFEIDENQLHLIEDELESPPKIIDIICYESDSDLKAICTELFDKHQSAANHKKEVTKIAKKNYPESELKYHSINRNDYFKYLKKKKLENNSENKLRFIYA